MSDKHIVWMDVRSDCGPPNEPWNCTFRFLLTLCSYVPGLKII